jgi:hypothetical protein
MRDEKVPPIPDLLFEFHLGPGGDVGPLAPRRVAVHGEAARDGAPRPTMAGPERG